VEAWIALSRGGRVAAIQREAWRAWGIGESGLIYAPTGSGKTLAALGGPDDRSDRARRNGVSWGRRLRFESLRNFDLPIPSKARTFESSFAIRKPMNLRRGDAWLWTYQVTTEWMNCQSRIRSTSLNVISSFVRS
jgi:hypothetical protein